MASVQYVQSELVELLDKIKPFEIIMQYHELNFRLPVCVFNVFGGGFDLIDLGSVAIGALATTRAVHVETLSA